MDTKENLIAARKLIEKPENWTKRYYARNKEQEEVPVLSRDAVCFCSIGALAKASGEGLGVEGNDAYQALARRMGVSVSRFNDTHTHVEVLAKFDEAIAACGGEA